MPSAFYRIHDRNIHAMHAPGGPVYDLISDVSKLGSELAKMEVHVRSGKLKNSIRWNRPKQEGGYSIAGLVYANARHAHWNHEGTESRVPRPKKGRYMTVPRKRGSVSGGQLRREWMADKGRSEKPYFLATAVRGYKGNPYLKIGIELAMARDTRLGKTFG